MIILVPVIAEITLTPVGVTRTGIELINNEKVYLDIIMSRYTLSLFISSMYM